MHDLLAELVYRGDQAGLRHGIKSRNTRACGELDDVKDLGYSSTSTSTTSSPFGLHLIARSPLHQPKVHIVTSDDHGVTAPNPDFEEPTAEVTSGLHRSTATQRFL